LSGPQRNSALEAFSAFQSFQTYDPFIRVAILFLPSDSVDYPSNNWQDIQDEMPAFYHQIAALKCDAIELFLSPTFRAWKTLIKLNILPCHNISNAQLPGYSQDV
jgi:hypothetical protein